ncbi:hypothetical protein BSL78_06238 [Apostichopus japonicus]|uniref:Uncharacterized protein n=1 Tax=Stichopus japonicus TaxID=307972 RepID=A0A2G8L9A5_STIJA|nr:hypothetical protein BSL78_06238 [Apostichopus japonicus]
MIMHLGITHFIDPSKVSSDYDLPDSPSSDGSSPISSPDEPGYKNNSFSIQNILGEGSKSHLTSTIFEQTSDNVDFNNNHKSSLNSVRHSAETLKQVRNDMAAILKPTAIRESAGIPIADSHWLVPPGFTQIQPSSPLTPPNVAHAWSPWCSSPFGLPRPLVQAGEDHMDVLGQGQGEGSKTLRTFALSTSFVGTVLRNALKQNKR